MDSLSKETVMNLRYRRRQIKQLFKTKWVTGTLFLSPKNFWIGAEFYNGATKSIKIGVPCIHIMFYFPQWEDKKDDWFDARCKAPAFIHGTPFPPLIKEYPVTKIELEKPLDELTELEIETAAKLKTWLET